MIKCPMYLFLVLVFIVSDLQYSQAQSFALRDRDFSIDQLPAPGTMVGESELFSPLMLKGLLINPHKPLDFRFIVDTGRGPQDDASIKQQAAQLVKYFLAGLTIPDGDLWVNLSPYEKSRIITTSLGQTTLGRDLLAEDYVLKQLTASLIYPEKGLGKEFWRRVYHQAKEHYATTDITVNTFNKVWVLPDQAQVFERSGAAYVTKSTLKVMLDEDYMARQKHQETYASSFSSRIVREIVVPEISKDVNGGKNFALLRQIYDALILAKWYKETIENGLLDTAFINKSKVAGIDLTNPGIKEQIYQRYVQAYKKGVFNYIREDSAPGRAARARKYFSGGLVWNMKVDNNGREADVTTDGAMVALDVSLSKSSGLVRPDTAMVSPIPEHNFLSGLKSAWEEKRATGLMTLKDPSKYEVFQMGDWTNVFYPPAPLLPRTTPIEQRNNVRQADGTRFRFLNQPKEVQDKNTMFEGMVGDQLVRVRFNNGPQMLYHALIMPQYADGHKNLIRGVDISSLLELSARFAVEFKEEHLVFIYNSFGAGGQVDQLHIHLFIVPNNRPLAIERAVIRPMVTTGKGLAVSELKDYPVRGFVFQGGAGLVSDALGDISKNYQDANQPENVIVSGSRVFVIPRRAEAIKINGQYYDIGGLEISGRMEFPTRELASQVSDRDIYKFLKPAGFNQQDFSRLRTGLEKDLAMAHPPVLRSGKTIFRQESIDRIIRLTQKEPLIPRDVYIMAKYIEHAPPLSDEFLLQEIKIIRHNGFFLTQKPNERMQKTIHAAIRILKSYCDRHGMGFFDFSHLVYYVPNFHAQGAALFYPFPGKILLGDDQDLLATTIHEGVHLISRGGLPDGGLNEGLTEYITEMALSESAEYKEGGMHNDLHRESFERPKQRLRVSYNPYVSLVNYIINNVLPKTKFTLTDLLKAFQSSDVVEIMDILGGEERFIKLMDLTRDHGDGKFLSDGIKLFSDMSMAENVQKDDLGGIDLNRIRLNRSGHALKIAFDPAQLVSLMQGGFEGFSFQVTGMTRVQSVLPLLGLGHK